MREVLRQLGYHGESKRVAVTRGGKDVFETEGVLYLEDTSVGDWPGMSYWGGQTIEEVNARYAEDNKRRHDFLSKHVELGREILDFGCGTGGFLLGFPDHLRRCGVEPHPVAESLRPLGVEVEPRISSFSEKFPTITAFHVLEHLHKPIFELDSIRRRMWPSGTLIVEVPHARDRLLKLTRYNPKLLHNEHMILHTERSLRALLLTAGFFVESIEGVQRYGLANHWGWLTDGDKLPPIPDGMYRDRLIQNGESDTLIAVAKAGF